MYIIYLYIIYILFISLSVVSKNSSLTDPPHVCYDLIVICYLLFVMIVPVQGCLVGGDQTCVTTLLLT